MTTHRPASAQELSLHLLVLRCQTGDERAFARLMDSFGARTLGYLRGLVGDDAEDVQQEVWLAVYRRLHTLTNPGAFRTWLFRTTRHRAVDFLRKRERERELIDDVPMEDVAAADDPNEPGMAAIEDAALGGALAAMPPPQREVLLLRYRDDLSYAEIALVVGCPIGTVRTRLHHAKRRLNDLLKRGIA
jgi:RNA polymerase sigma-70 factor, ECF subfamily